jgi:DNA-binding NarL/FixJ family response regulator
MKVVIVDDDEFKRAGMAHKLASHPEIEVVDTVDQDTAAAQPLSAWEPIDAVLVDVCDDLALGEVGTDVYSGINVVERVYPIRNLRCIAITPVCPNPLVQLRLQHAHPDYSYHRFQLNRLDTLLEAVRFPDKSHRLPELTPQQAKRLGGSNFTPNKMVRAFVASPLHGHLQATWGHKEFKGVGIERGAIDAYCTQAELAGYNHIDTLPQSRRKDKLYMSPRWPVVRSLTLKLLGRQDAPPTEHDKPWW